MSFRRPATDITLFRWIWRSYVRNGLVPLLLVELLLVAAFVASHAWSLRHNAAAMREVARSELVNTAAQESSRVEERLRQVEGLTEVLRLHAERALSSPPDVREDRSRLTIMPGGLIHTNRNDGGAAVYYSALTPKGPAAWDKIARTASLDHIMKDISAGSPLIAQVYFLTTDSLSRVWPWIDAAAQFAPNDDVRRYNFFYEADPDHDPGRGIVWTDGYLDPAGKGWIVSCVAPVYRGDAFEGVVGADVTLNGIVDLVLEGDVPWNGFELLVDRTGSLLTLPRAATAFFGLPAFASDQHARPVQGNPPGVARQNLYRLPRAASFSGLVRDQDSGIAETTGAEKYLVAWHIVPQTGWKYVVVVPRKEVFAPARQLSTAMSVVGWTVVAGLVAFYAVFLTILYYRARRITRALAAPLEQIDDMTARFAVGEYDHPAPNFEIVEFRKTVAGLAEMGRRLGASDRARLAAEQAARDRNRELSTMLALSPAGVVAFDSAGCVSETNPAFEQMTGFMRAQLIGLDHATFWRKFGELSREPVAAAGAGGTVTVNLERPRPTVVQVRTARVHAEGDSLGEVAYFRDVTGDYELDRLKSEFVATAAHELRNPLAVIQGYAELLERGAPAGISQQDVVATIQRHCRHVSDIVNELLDLARIEARGGRDFTMQRREIGAIVAAFAQTFRAPGDSRQPVYVSTGVPPIQAYVDTDKFTEALGNVVSNAFKYSPAGGPVEIRLVARGPAGQREVGVCVRDQGIGMTSEETSRMFDRFYRGTPASAIPGTGLGLSIVKEIIDIHQGSVQVQSAPGAGTEVTLWLPEAPPAAGAHTPPPSPEGVG
jgi:PAS domain S-box-containing protein